MRKIISSEVRRLEVLLVDKLIPAINQDPQVILLDAPPRSLKPIEITESLAAQLPPIPATSVYPQVRVWEPEDLNSINVPLLGCVFEGGLDYVLHSPPGKDGRQWKVPIQAGEFFLVPPGIPFSRGRGTDHSSYARGILIHLRRDCIFCFGYTADQSRLWQTSGVLLYELDAQLLASRLIHELQRETNVSPRIISMYAGLILEVMLRSIREGRYANRHDRIYSKRQSATESTSTPQFGGWVQVAEDYIQEHLDDPDLTCREIALYTGISERHLERLFKSETGLSPVQLLQQRRLAKARELLVHPGLTMAVVARHCGFRRASHFSAWFARHENCSPTAFRKRLMSEN